MEISSLLAHHLDADVRARLAVAMKALNPGIDQDIDKILDIANTKNARLVEDFFPDFPDAELKDTALAIISAWYTAVVVDAPNAEVFAYELALIYQPSSDVMTIPSYAISGPNGWNACPNSFEVVAREWFAKYSATGAANHRDRIEFVYLTRKVNFEDLDYDLKPREAWPFLKRCTIRLWQDFDARSRP
jgi:hypothetical protein